MRGVLTHGDVNLARPATCTRHPAPGPLEIATRATVRYLSVENATQTLHRLTSYAPGRDWDVASDDPRIVQDLEANDMTRLPWT
jgi:hypothetical protein